MVRSGARSSSVRILDGHDEALLGFRSALAHFDLGTGRTVVIDIGGGSLELALQRGRTGRPPRLAALRRAPPNGALLLEEGITPPRRQDLRRDVRAELPRTSPGARVAQRAGSIGSGGTFTNLAGMSLARQGHAPRAQRARHARHARRARAHPRRAAGHDARRATHRARTQRGTRGHHRRRTRGDRRGDGASRQRRVSSCPRTAFARGCCSRRRRVLPTSASPGDARERSVRAPRRGVSLRGAALDARAAARAAALRCPRTATRCSAGRARCCSPRPRVLHDIGYHISYDKHHKHSFYLITHAELLGMSPAEQLVIANVARYHRGARHESSTRRCRRSTEACADQVRRLAAILAARGRLRPRAHLGAVARVKVRWMRTGIRITPMPRNGGTSRCASNCGVRAERRSFLRGLRACPSRSSSPNDSSGCSAPAGAGVDTACEGAAAPHVVDHRTTGCVATLRLARRRLPLLIAAVGAQVPRLPVVAQTACRAACAATSCSNWILDRHHRLDAARRSCAASSRRSRCRTPPSPPFRKYQTRECSRNRPTMLITRMRSLTPASAGTQAADAAHDQIDLHARLRRRVERGDHLRIDERVHLRDDARRPARARVLGLALDQLEEALAHVAGRDDQLPVVPLPRKAGEHVEQVASGRRRCSGLEVKSPRSV